MRKLVLILFSFFSLNSIIFSATEIPRCKPDKHDGFLKFYVNKNDRIAVVFLRNRYWLINGQTVSEPRFLPRKILGRGALHDPNGDICVAGAKGGDRQIYFLKLIYRNRQYNLTEPIPILGKNESASGGRCGLGRDHEGRLWITYIAGSGLMAKHSKDEGKTWSPATLVSEKHGSPGSINYSFHLLHGRLWLAFLLTRYKMTFRYLDGDQWKEPQDATVSASKDVMFAICGTPSSTNIKTRVKSMPDGSFYALDMKCEKSPYTSLDPSDMAVIGAIDFCEGHELVPPAHWAVGGADGAYWILMRRHDGKPGSLWSKPEIAFKITSEAVKRVKPMDLGREVRAGLRKEKGKLWCQVIDSVGRRQMRMRKFIYKPGSKKWVEEPVGIKGLGFAFEKVWGESAGKFTDFTSAALNDEPGDVPMFAPPAERIYLGCKEPFDFVHLFIHQGVFAKFKPEAGYWNGNEWKSLQIQRSVLYKEDYLNFASPKDWQKKKIGDGMERYYMRLNKTVNSPPPSLIANQITGFYDIGYVSVEEDAILWMDNRGKIMFEWR